LAHRLASRRLFLLGREPRRLLPRDSLSCGLLLLRLLPCRRLSRGLLFGVQSQGLGTRRFLTCDLLTLRLQLSSRASRGVLAFCLHARGLDAGHFFLLCDLASLCFELRCRASRGFLALGLESRRLCSCRLDARCLFLPCRRAPLRLELCRR
jgi:hypothetical protein